MSDYLQVHEGPHRPGTCGVCDGISGYPPIKVDAKDKRIAELEKELGDFKAKYVRDMEAMEHQFNVLIDAHKDLRRQVYGHWEKNPWKTWE